MLSDDATSLSVATDNAGARRQAVLVDGRGGAQDVVEPILALLGWLLFFVIHPARMADHYGSSGQLVNTAPVSSSTRVTRAPGRLPCSPIHDVNFRRAVASLAHQPCATTPTSADRVRWKRSGFT